MMKRAKKTRILVSGLRALAAVIFVCALLAGGCGSWARQPGETIAEGNRRHSRALSINQQEMMQDIDTFLLLDKPSKLTDKRIP
jgi:hypothetical protein